MSFSGLFLTLFLVVHLLGNLQLLIPDGGEAFNAYVHVMESNIAIKVIAIGLYLTIIFHTIKGFALWSANRKARGKERYAVKKSSGSSFASRNMIWLGSILFIFIAIHMSQFWYLYKFGHLEEDEFFKVVQEGFKQPWIVIFYVLAQIALGWHLIHGFQSAFQTLGFNQGKYTKLIQNIGVGFSVAVPLLFAVIPILMYLDIYPMFDFRVFPGQ